MISMVRSAPSAKVVPRLLENKLTPAADLVGTSMTTCCVVVMEVVGEKLTQMRFLWLGMVTKALTYKLLNLVP